MSCVLSLNPSLNWPQSQPWRGLGAFTSRWPSSLYCFKHSFLKCWMTVLCAAFRQCWMTLIPGWPTVWAAVLLAMDTTTWRPLCSAPLQPRWGTTSHIWMKFHESFSKWLDLYMGKLTVWQLHLRSVNDMKLDLRKWQNSLPVAPSWVYFTF